MESNDVTGAVELLRRMTLVAGEPFETLNAAAELLSRFHRNKEAAEFWNSRVKAAPWDLEAGVRLATTTGDVATLRRIAASNDAPYSSRTDAAGALAKTNAKGLGSAELDALASESILSIPEIDKPYFYEARLKAAAQTKDSNPRVALLRAAIAVNPATNGPPPTTLPNTFPGRAIRSGRLGIPRSAGFAGARFGNGISKTRESGSGETLPVDARENRSETECQIGDRILGCGTPADFRRTNGACRMCMTTSIRPTV